MLIRLWNVGLNLKSSLKRDITPLDCLIGSHVPYKLPSSCVPHLKTTYWLHLQQVPDLQEQLGSRVVFGVKLRGLNPSSWSMVEECKHPQRTHTHRNTHTEPLVGCDGSLMDSPHKPNSTITWRDLFSCNTSPISDPDFCIRQRGASVSGWFILACAPAGLICS